MTLRIAHLSDLHVLDLAGTAPHRFLNKRLTGVANLLGARRDAHPLRIAEALAATLQGLDVAHVVITGDLSNLALESEFSRARQVVERIGGPERVTVIPGNHDVYTRGAAKAGRFERFFAPWMVDLPLDDATVRRAEAAGRSHYPFGKTVAPGVRVYGLSSAIPAGPLIAWGEVGDPQLDRLRALVAAEPPGVTHRIVLVHHNVHPRTGVAEATARLRDRDAVLRALRDVGATALLHGHTHPPQQHHLPAADGQTWVLGCGSSTWFKPASDAHEGPGHMAHFNVLTLADGGGLARAEAFVWDGDRFAPERDDLLSRARDRALHA